MARIRSANTKPEMIVRRLAHALGYRFRIHVSKLAGKPDLVFSSRKKVVFVHGCFWHQHPDPRCADARKPKSSISYWGPKLSRNVTRDAEHASALRAEGWDVLTIWECETADVKALAARLRHFLDDLVPTASRTKPAQG
jgi:DNA mismatch endonuclease, patch repair protein